MNRLIVFAVLFSLLSTVYTFANDGVKHFQAEDVFELEYANEPRVSPDGSAIVYERRGNDIMTDRTRSNLWIVNVDGSGHRPLVSGTESATSPRWSPGGDRIAYLQATDSGNGIFVRWMDSGQTALLANLRQSVSSLTWSPDGKSLALVMSVPTEAASLVAPRVKPEGADWSEPVKVIDSARYRWDGRGFLDPAFAHVFVLPADGGTPRQLTEGKFNHEGALSWTADSKQILFAANRSPGWELQSGETDIFSVAVDDGTLAQLTERSGSESSPTVSPNGQMVAYVYDRNRKVAYRNRILHENSGLVYDPTGF
jgi:Tol biopolymer transport system component